MPSQMKWGLIALIVFVPAVGLPVLWNEIQQVRDAQKRVACDSYIYGVSYAMRNYHDSHGHFPPAYVLGPDGKPWHSWRVILLPYIGWDELHKEYRFDEPWDGPNNSKLHDRMPHSYCCPGDPEHRTRGRPNYFVVVGAGTAFPGAQTTKFADITRPHGATILLVEAVGQDINWLEPRDLSFTDMNFETDDRQSPTISSKHRYPNVALVDGTRRSLHDVSPLDLRAMFLIHPELH